MKIQTFLLSNNEYKYIWFKDLSEDDLPDAANYRQIQYINLNCAFDIETSKIESDKISWMYIWQFAVNDLTILGRTWQEFRDLLNMLSTKYATNEKSKILCWVHHLSYEFSFMKSQLQWYITKEGYPDVFATDYRNILRCMTSNFIEFRDSLALTNKSLDRLAKDYNVGISKLKDSFNYDLLRTSDSNMHLCELAYCINDVQILARFNEVYIKKYYWREKKKVPLTSTGIVRSELKAMIRKQPKKEREKYKRRVQSGFPTDEKEYKDLMKWVYRGGFVHANASMAAQTFINMDGGSEDFKSSYPASALHYDFPWRFVKRPASFFNRIKYNRKWMNKNAFYGCFKFTNIIAYTPHTIESKNKIIQSSGAIYDNGRLTKADYIIVALTELDWLNYLDFYKFDSVECLGDLRISSKEPLPIFMIDMILKYFAKKETLPKDDLDYMLSKQKLNSVYGMCVTSLYNDKLIYNADTHELELSGEDIKDYEKLKKEQFLLPFFGIWISAYSRFNLLHYGFKKLPYQDAIYGDTDSIKLLNFTSNKYIFDDYNERMQRINDKMYVGSYDRKLFKDIGKFDFEGKLWKFRTLGAKRYLYSNVKNGMLETHTTVAGMKKGTFEKYCSDNNLDPYEAFESGLVLDEIESGKMTAAYNDEGFTANVTDYFGNESVVSENSCVTLYKIPFEMTLTNEYINQIMQLRLANQLRVGDRRW